MKAEEKQMTDQERESLYLKQHALRCPYCASPDITAGSSDFDDNIAWRAIYCNTCDKQWTENFAIVSITFD
jgi:formate dehydrogenase maturation protein FdhE